ncbi:MAG: PIN domain-containing protein [Dehalococcoidia bacterium]
MISHAIPRATGMIVLGVGGWQIGLLLGDALESPGFFFWGLIGTIVGVVLGGAVTPYVTVVPARAFRNILQEVPASRIVAGIVGLIVGLVVAVLVSTPLTRISGWPGVWIPVALSVIFALAGVLLLLSREGDLFQFVSSNSHTPGAGQRSTGQIIVDTSAIIDGRIADIAQTGFVNGTLIIPRFVLDELRHIADSSDALRRNRGRRGLEMLNKLRKEANTPVQVLDVDRWDGMEVDGKLVKVAKSLGAPIATTDFNLNRVAEIQGVRVLNVNELANALKAVVLPGEELQVHVIQEGREVGQGVAFLDDGTMVVVENGRRYLDKIVGVTVTRVLQTAAGRLIFAQPGGR